jgi:hypothetical protein
VSFATNQIMAIGVTYGPLYEGDPGYRGRTSISPEMIETRQLQQVYKIRSALRASMQASLLL